MVRRAELKKSAPMADALEHRARATMWLQSLVGGATSVKEARRLRLDKLCAVTQEHAELSSSVQQIDKDLPRLDVNLASLDFHETPNTRRRRVRKVLLAWLALNNFVGYSQGMDMVCHTLLCAYERGESSTPLNDTLASLAAVANINSNIVPLHAMDATPIRHSKTLAHRVWDEVTAAAPSLQAPLHAVMPQLQMFVLRVLPPCFCNVVDRQDALECLWDFLLLAEPRLRAPRCRNLVSAMLLHHRRLFEFGEDCLQNFVIFEHLVGLTTEEQARQIVNVAKHLERVDTMCHGTGNGAFL